MILTDKQIRMNFRHLTKEERRCVRENYKNGKSCRKFAVYVLSRNSIVRLFEIVRPVYAFAAYMSQSREYSSSIRR